MTCPLCRPVDETVLWRNDHLRVIAVDDEANAPAFCRVIWQAHIAEMTDLTVLERDELMRVVYAVEHALRTILNPCKINLANLGNKVPHLHWHIIARFEHDACFPEPIWVTARREARVDLPLAWRDQVSALLNTLLSNSK